MNPPAPEPVYDCAKCQDTGSFPIIDRNGNERYGTCECAIRKRYLVLCKNAGFDINDAKGIDDYKLWNKTAMDAKTKAVEYIKNFDTIRNENKNWFVVFGQSGSGKTMLGRAIVKALLQRKKPVRARAVKFYEMMQRLKANSNETDYWKVLEPYTDCELLFIDDMLKEKVTYGDMTEADIKHLFAVIDARYDARKPTVITTECTCERIEILNDAIYYRMMERAFATIIFEGTECNYRKRL